MQGKIYSGGQVRVACWECGKLHGAKACPKAQPRRRETPGRKFLRAYREEFERLHGPQRWKVAI